MWCIPISWKKKCLLLEAEILVHAGDEEDIFTLSCWTSWEGFSTAGTCISREKIKLFLNFWSWSDNPPVHLCFSQSFQANAAGEFVYDDRNLHTDLCHMCHCTWCYLDFGIIGICSSRPCTPPAVQLLSSYTGYFLPQWSTCLSGM